jgi:hypothetical protein
MAPAVDDAGTGRATAAPAGNAPILALLAALAAIAPALAGCSASDCAYYGNPDYQVHCVITGPSPTGGNN